MSEKLNMQTPNITEQNMEQIAKLFPHVMTETQDKQGKVKKAIDFDRLKQSLSSVLVDDADERYRLDWPGKKASLLKANTPITKTLRPCREDSVNFDSTENVYIEGDNFEVLKILQESYLGKIKMIYIDPPYNTGKDFIYKDNFTAKKADYEEELGTTDEDDNKLFKNTDTNGRFHSDWLSMMYERLVIARDLLKEDGVIFISIGSDEIKNTINLLEDVFGEENKISLITWEQGRKNDSTFFSESVDYIVIFAKNRSLLSSLGAWREKKESVDSIFDFYKKCVEKYNSEYNVIEDKMRSFYKKLQDSDPRKNLKHFYRSDKRGLFFGADISSASTSIPDYNIIHPVTQKAVKKPTRGWGATEPVMLERIKEGRVLFGEDETTIPLKKSYLSEVDSIVKTPVIYKDGRAASGVVKQLFEKAVFNNPKDHLVIADYISYCLQGNINGVILDFFSGSATTAHAVMQLNAEDNGNRKFIMVQLPEATDEKSEAYTDYKTIAEIGKERIRRAGNKIVEDNQGKEGIDKLDIGFRVYKTDTSNMKEVYYHPEKLKQTNLPGLESNIKKSRTNDDLLTQVILDLGLELNLPIEQKTMHSNNVFIVQTNALVACFDDNINMKIIDEIAKLKPFKVVFKDASFNASKDRINLEERFKRLSPETLITVI